MGVFNSMWQLVNDYPTVGILVIIPFVLLYAHLMSKKMNWIKFEIFLGICCAASIPFSSYTLSLWVEVETDALMLVLFRFVLLGMIAQAVAFYLTKDSMDVVIQTSLSITNLMVRGGLLIAAGYALEHAEGFSPLALKADCAFLTLLMIGDFMHLKRMPTTYGQLIMTNGKKPRVCMSIDAVSFFIIGLVLLGFSDTICEIIIRGTNVSSIHRLLLKSFGLQAIASALLSLTSLCFKARSDAAQTLLSKFVVYVPMLVLSFWSAITYGPSQTDWSLLGIIFISFFLIMNTMLGPFIGASRFGDDD